MIYFFTDIFLLIYLFSKTSMISKGLSHKRKINAVRQPLNFSKIEYKFKKQIKPIYYEMLK